MNRCATAVPVGASRRSSPAISRFCPVLGWRTMLQLLARRAAESNVFSVPDRNALWSRVEDVVQEVAKYSTSNVLGHDWSEVVSELPGRSKQQCKERYRLADTVDPLPSDPRSFSQKLQTRRILHDLFTTVHLMSSHPLPFPPCSQPPRSRMYTGTSVLATQPGRRCLPLRN
jgi:hypothetical protein